MMLRLHRFFIACLLTGGLVVWLPGHGFAQSPAVGVAEAEALRLTYLGTAGWIIDDGETVILVDPYLTRFKRGAPATWDPADTRDPVAPTDTIAPDRALIDSIIERADYIVVHHTHPDHVHDVPYIAAKTGAAVIGTASAINLLRAYGVPDEQLYAVRGGEDYDFGEVTIRVVPSLHSPLGEKHYYDDRVIADDVTRPVRVEQLVEGRSLTYLLRIGGHEILTMGSMNFIEREMEGLRPDIALVGAAPSHLQITDYTGRLLRALGHPQLVIPTHWDRFSVPYSASQAQRVEDWVMPFLEEVKAASPDAQTIVPQHLVAIVMDKGSR